MRSVWGYLQQVDEVVEKTEINPKLGKKFFFKLLSLETWFLISRFLRDLGSKLLGKLRLLADI